MELTETTGVVGVLVAGYAAVAMAFRALWKAYVEKENQVKELQSQLVAHTDAVKQLSPALDRLRTEVLCRLEGCQYSPSCPNFSPRQPQ